MIYFSSFIFVSIVVSHRCKSRKALKNQCNWIEVKFIDANNNISTHTRLDNCVSNMVLFNVLHLCILLYYHWDIFFRRVVCRYEASKRRVGDRGCSFVFSACRSDAIGDPQCFARAELTWRACSLSRAGPKTTTTTSAPRYTAFNAPPKRQRSQKHLLTLAFGMYCWLIAR